MEEINTFKAGKELGNKLLPLRSFLDQDGLLCVGGRLGLSELPYTKRHPLVLPGKHQLTKLNIRNEHVRLLHAGPVLVRAVGIAQAAQAMAWALFLIPHSAHAQF